MANSGCFGEQTEAATPCRFPLVARQHRAPRAPVPGSHRSHGTRGDFFVGGTASVRRRRCVTAARLFSLRRAPLSGGAACAAAARSFAAASPACAPAQLALRGLCGAFSGLAARRRRRRCWHAAPPPRPERRSQAGRCCCLISRPYSLTHVRNSRLQTEAAVRVHRCKSAGASPMMDRAFCSRTLA